MAKEDCIAEVKQYIEEAYHAEKETEFVAALMAMLGVDPEAFASVCYLAYLESVEEVNGTGATRITKI